MYWSSKIGQDRSENVKMYVAFTQAQTRGVARGAGTVLFVLYKLACETLLWQTQRITLLDMKLKIKLGLKLNSC